MKHWHESWNPDIFAHHWHLMHARTYNWHRNDHPTQSDMLFIRFRLVWLISLIKWNIDMKHEILIYLHTIDIWCVFVRIIGTGMTIRLNRTCFSFGFDSFDSYLICFRTPSPAHIISANRHLVTMKSFPKCHFIIVWLGGADWTRVRPTQHEQKSFYP